ncbi:TlpA family protein disulfide reductase [Aestuariibius sp. 2305UL40-4]|uniref:TlpA family protein disulfide reductase n=1 Tax=Aestuariibius violaceus TaxID=3234132 RepID=UPI00345F04A2
MRLLGFAALYMGLASFANADPALEALKDGDMRKLVIHATPDAPVDAPFLHEDGSETTLAAWEGQVVVLNFWATWCAPCRKEMPHLSALQEEMGGEDFQVVTVATGRNPPEGMARFLNEIGVDNLPLHRDPRQSLARSAGVLGLPVTVLLDRQGREVARLQGDADWSSESAKAIIAAVIEGAS